MSGSLAAAGAGDSGAAASGRGRVFKGGPLPFVPGLNAILAECPFSLSGIGRSFDTLVQAVYQPGRSNTPGRAS